jgi:hypothetical protein
MEDTRASSIYSGNTIEDLSKLWKSARDKGDREGTHNGSFCIPLSALLIFPYLNRVPAIGGIYLQSFVSE